MFSLRDCSSASSSRMDEDSFGWWIGVESQTNFDCTQSETIEATTKDVILPRANSFVNSESDSTSSCACSDEYLLSSKNNDEEELTVTAVSTVTDNNDDVEHIELCSFDGIERSSHLLVDLQRRATCYTPERLVRDEDYKILIPSVRFVRPSYAEFPNERMEFEKKNCDDQFKDGKMGASQLLKLLESLQEGSFSTSRSGNRCCRCVRYGGGQVLLHNERCSRDESTQDKSYMIRTPADMKIQAPSSEYGSFDEHSRQDNETHQHRDVEEFRLCDQDSSGVSSVDTITASQQADDDDDDDDWSCAIVKTVAGDEQLNSAEIQPRRLSHELAYASFEYALVSPDKPDSEIPSEVVSLLADLDPERAQALLSTTDEDRFQNSMHSGHDCLSRLALAIEPDGRLVWRPRALKPRVPHDDPGPELERLRGKIDRLHGSSRQMHEEISTLRTDFAKDEWKINDLSDDVRKLRNEVCELRYLDDLLKLLKGELDRISKRNWPFAIGNVKQGREEINLVV